VTSEPEPQHVTEARRVIREWELRNGHATYVDCIVGRWADYQAACDDCDWRGTERVIRQAAQVDASVHSRQTRPT
jgi:hypothetical protein